MLDIFIIFKIFLMCTIFKVTIELQYCFCFIFWFIDQVACEILAPRPKIEPTPPHWKEKSQPLDCQGSLCYFQKPSVYDRNNLAWWLPLRVEWRLPEKESVELPGVLVMLYICRRLYNDQSSEDRHLLCTSQFTRAFCLSRKKKNL